MGTNRYRQAADPQSLLLGAQRQQRPMSDIMLSITRGVALKSAKIPTCALSVLLARDSRCHNAPVNVGNVANVDNFGMLIIPRHFPWSVCSPPLPICSPNVSENR